MIRIRPFLLAAFALLLAAPSAAQTDTAALRRRLEATTLGYGGVVGISVRNLATGESLSIRGGETFPTASLIKVAVLVALLEEVERGTMRLDEPITMIARDRVGVPFAKADGPVAPDGIKARAC